MQDTNAELTSLLEAEKQHTSIIGSLSNVFFALYYIDIEGHSYREIFSPDYMHYTYGEKGDVYSQIKGLVEATVNDEYKSAVRIFTDIDTVDERLGDNKIITQEFMSATGEWVRVSFFPVEKNEYGNNTKIIFGLRNISAEKERLESQDNLIQALVLPYENVYAVNMDTSEAICYRMGETIISEPVHIGVYVRLFGKFCRRLR